MREKLLELYNSRKIDFEYIDKNCTVKVNGPFLLSPTEMYSRQPNPLLIIGQETNGFCKNEKDLEKRMDCYEKFGSGIEYNRKSSPFWNVTRKIEKILGDEEYSCAWTNISKYDQENKTPSLENTKFISKVDNLLIEEINILKPKVCIFYTSYKFDLRIQNIFNEVEFISIPEFEKKQVCQLKHAALPELTFRTYHPGYLRRKKLLIEGFLKLVETIVK